MSTWIAVGLGGALGAWARLTVSLLLEGTRLPYATLIVNLVGCLLLGALSQWISIHPSMIPQWLERGAGVGTLGALTTFSTFANDTVRLAEDGRWQAAAANIGANLILGLAAVLLGISAVRFFNGQ